ncbi:hypothetical protein NBRC111894_2608 [Sporolactobacillus inulinus]|uniref:Uncharacterized protein n=1 Tax=Sporolactobacillus inulinus TaxID=2078 RepID=A0A4Y1ZDI8_9BACL|nr:hypothetical protein NBRC111894_2608 [Sporolactobacillus inulinus]
MFIRNESFKLFLKLYPITAILLGINVLLYLLFVLTGTWRLAPEFAFTIFNFAAGSNDAILTAAPGGNWSHRSSCTLPFHIFSLTHSHCTFSVPHLNS